MREVAALRERLGTVRGLTVLGGPGVDPAKVCLLLPGTGADGLHIEADLIARGMPVELADRDAIVAMVTLAAAECGFGYRDSLVKRAGGRFVVLEVVFQLALTDLSAPVRYADLASALEVTDGERVPLADAREAVLAQRRRRGMVLDPADHDTWSCGSFFTNPLLPPADFQALLGRVAERFGPDGPAPPAWETPDGVKTSAAWLIERAGFGKGFGMPGPAALSTKHTLAITNRGTASAAAIIDLARTIRDGVAAAFGVRLVNEPVLIGLDL